MSSSPLSKDPMRPSRGIVGATWLVVAAFLPLAVHYSLILFQESVNTFHRVRLVTGTVAIVGLSIALVFRLRWARWIAIGWCLGVWANLALGHTFGGEGPWDHVLRVDRWIAAGATFGLLVLASPPMRRAFDSGWVTLAHRAYRWSAISVAACLAHAVNTGAHAVVAEQSRWPVVAAVLLGLSVLLLSAARSLGLPLAVVALLVFGANVDGDLGDLSLRPSTWITGARQWAFFCGGATYFAWAPALLVVLFGHAALLPHLVRRFGRAVAWVTIPLMIASFAMGAHLLIDRLTAPPFAKRVVPFRLTALEDKVDIPSFWPATPYETELLPVVNTALEPPDRATGPRRMARLDGARHGLGFDYGWSGDHVYQSRDRGQTWSLIAITRFPLTDLAFLSEREAVAQHAGGWLLSTTGGRAWHTSQDPRWEEALIGSMGEGTRDVDELATACAGSSLEGLQLDVGYDAHGPPFVSRIELQRAEAGWVLSGRHADLNPDILARSELDDTQARALADRVIEVARLRERPPSCESNSVLRVQLTATCSGCVRSLTFSTSAALCDSLWDHVVVPSTPSFSRAAWLSKFVTHFFPDPAVFGPP